MKGCPGPRIDLLPERGRPTLITLLVDECRFSVTRYFRVDERTNTQTHEHIVGRIDGPKTRYNYCNLVTGLRLQFQGSFRDEGDTGCAPGLMED